MRCSDTSSASPPQIGLAIVAINLFVALFAPLIAPLRPDDARSATPGPTPTRSTGSASTISGAIFSAASSMGRACRSAFRSSSRRCPSRIGVLSGFAAAVAGGWVDQALSRLVDLLLSMPTLIFAFVILSVLGSALPVLIVTIAMLDSTKVFRLARSVAISIVSLEFVEAARLRGEGWWWIVTREILPNAVPPLTAEFGLRFCFTFLFIAALSFLGLGVQPPAPTGAAWSRTIAT